MCDKPNIPHLRRQALLFIIREHLELLAPVPPILGYLAALVEADLAETPGVTDVPYGNESDSKIAQENPTP